VRLEYTGHQFEKANGIEKANGKESDLECGSLWFRNMDNTKRITGCRHLKCEHGES